MKETLDGGDAEDIFGGYVASELQRLDASRQRIGKKEIKNSLNHLATNPFSGKVSSVHVGGRFPPTYNKKY